ncbi:MAG: hypothetical protein H8D97_01810 [Proteobacteria bacterium]|nr:hypothetical protein [Pseudomonadota bacterium]
MKKDFFIVYVKIRISKLYTSCTHRTEEFYDNHPEYILMRNKIKQSILEEGLRYPLCIYNEKDDGNYRIDVGSQRYDAFKELVQEELIEDGIFCLLHYKKGQINIPIGDKVPRDKRTIEIKYFKGRTKRFELDINNLLIVPSENDRWDPDFQFSTHDNPEIIKNTKLQF